MNDLIMSFFKERGITVKTYNNRIMFYGRLINYDIEQADEKFILYQTDDNGNEDRIKSSYDFNNLIITIMLEANKVVANSRDQIETEKKELFNNNKKEEIEYKLVNKYKQFFSKDVIQPNKVFIVMDGDLYIAGFASDSKIYESISTKDYETALNYAYYKIKDMDEYAKSFKDLVDKKFVEESRYSEFLAGYLLEPFEDVEIKKINRL